MKKGFVMIGNPREISAYLKFLRDRQEWIREYINPDYNVLNDTEFLKEYLQSINDYRKEHSV